MDWSIHVQKWFLTPSSGYLEHRLRMPVKELTSMMNQFYSGRKTEIRWNLFYV
jgi:hypothetical protein